MILSTTTVGWAPEPNTLTLSASAVKPALPHTSVSALITTPTGLLGVRLVKRGWDIPGGHVEQGETAELALIREVREEAGIYLALAELSPVGFTCLEVTGEKPDDYAYPYPLTHQPIFAVSLTDARCANVRPHMPQESAEARVIPWAQVPVYFANRAWLDLALTLQP